MTHDEQLAAWVDGDSQHGAGKHEDCCPDFSCCQPELLAPLAERKTFAAGNESTRNAMLGTFLGRMLAAAGQAESVYAAGDPANYELKQ